MHDTNLSRLFALLLTTLVAGMGLTTPLGAQTIIDLKRGGGVRPKTIEDYKQEQKVAERLRADSVAYSEGVRMGFNALYRDSLDQAEAHFNRALKERPDGSGNYIIRYQLALIEQARGHLAQAVDRYTDILNSHPDYDDARISRAEANLRLSRLREAIDDAQNLLDRSAAKRLVADDILWRARFVRAAGRYGLHRYAEARADLAKLLLEDPTHEGVRLLEALTLQKMGQQAEALNRLNLIVSAHPESTDALSTRAGVLAELNRPAQARADYDALIKLAPNEADYYIERARLSIQLGEKVAARSDLDTAVRLGKPRGVVQALYNLTRQ